MRYLFCIATLIFNVLFCLAQEVDTIVPSELRKDIAQENTLLDAVALYDAGKLEMASELFMQIHKADSINDAALYYLGLCSHKAKKDADAEKYFKEAIRLDTLNLWYQNVLANLYIESGNPQLAAPLMERLVEKFPQAYNTPYFLSIIADSNVAQFKDSLALVYYDRALELDPRFAPAEMGKAELYRMRGNNPGFFSSLGKVVANPDVMPKPKSGYLKAILDHIDAKTWWVWGNEFCRMVDVCVELHPDDLDSRWLKVNTCAIKEDWDGAMEQCYDIVEIAGKAHDNENLVRAYSTLGDIFHEQKNDEKACFAMYDRALKVDPEYVPVLNNYAYYLSEKGIKLRKALKISAITVKEEPDNATYLDTYGWILHLLGKDEEAKPYFKHALIYGGRDSKVILKHYSEVLDALGDKEKADYYRCLSEKE